MLFLKLLAYFLKIRRNLHKFYHFFFIATFLHLLRKWSFTVTEFVDVARTWD